MQHRVTGGLQAEGNAHAAALLTGYYIDLQKVAVSSNADSCQCGNDRKKLLSGRDEVM